MASLSRNNWVAQQRVDLNHLLASDSYTAFDFRALLTAFTGSKPYVLRGFEVIGKTGLSITISLNDTLTFNPLDGNGSFYKGLPSDTDLVIDLPTDQQNIFVEARFINRSQAPINQAYWDALALTGQDQAGNEFPASTNSQILIVCQISVNTIGFSEDSIPILRATTDGSNVTNMIDCRSLLFRLGTGGTTPDASHKFPWGTSRLDPVANGSGVGDALDSPFRARDQSGVVNDKGLRSFKDWMDAVMTRLSEVSGSAVWYATDTSVNLPVYGYITGLDVPRVFLDSESGHSIQPSENVSLKWERLDPTLAIGPSNPLVLKSFGVDGFLPPPFGPADNCVSTVKWQANYGPVSWEVGGTFVNDTFGGSRQYTNSRFITAGPADGGNIYLVLERDIVPPHASGNAVSWASNTSYTGFNPGKTISGVPGDFTGIAVGDWVKKASEGFSQYYRVVRITNGTLIGIRDVIGDIADSTTIAVELDRTIFTGVSTETMRYFRSRYSQAEGFAVDTISGVYTSMDSNFYWIGRRVGNSFMLRGYGNLQEGEETLVKEDAFMAGGHTGGGGGSSDLVIQNAYGAVYNNVSGYSLRAGGPTLLTIHRRKRDNTIPYPGPVDNSGASLTYTIAAPVGLMSVGDGLWVRLSDTISGALTSGSVTDVTDDTQNIDVNTNRWEIRSPTNNPARTFDNKDVYLIARRVVLSNGDPALQFLDGSIVAPYGMTNDGYFEVNNDTRLKTDVFLSTKSPKSVLFIDQNTDPFAGQGRIDEDNVNFNYNKALQQFTLFNNVFGLNSLTLVNPTDQYWFTNLGAHSLYLGGVNSDIVIPGNLTVQGTETITNTQNVSTSDKNILLGIGNGLYGGGGSGLSVADNTIDWQTSPNYVVQFQTYAGQPYVDVTFFSDPLYVLGQLVGVASGFQLDQITEAQASLVYTRVVTAAVPGDVERLSATIWRFWTNGTALAGVVQSAAAVTNWQIYDILSEIHLGSSLGDPTFMTSWSFGVKRNPNNVQPANEGTVYAIVTPFESAPLAQDFVTIPKGRQANFVRKRIPFAWQDGVGPSGSDTTLDFSANLTWDYSTNTFGVVGTFSLTGNIVPSTDNLYDIGTTALRWHTLHVGPGSVVVHNDNTNTVFAEFKFVGLNATLSSDATTPFHITVGSQPGIWMGTAGTLCFGGTGFDQSKLLRLGDTASYRLIGTTQTVLALNQAIAGSVANTGVSISVSADPACSTSEFHALHVSNVSGTAVNNLMGLHLAALANATTVYGIYSEITAAATRWFIYGTGNATSYLAGGLGLGNNTEAVVAAQRLTIGTTADTTAPGGILLGGDIPIYRSATTLLRVGTKLRVDDSVGIGADPVLDAVLTVSGAAPFVTNSSAVGIRSTGKFSSSVTNSIDSFSATPQSGDLTSLQWLSGFRFTAPALGVGSIVTDVMGIYINDFGAAGMGNMYAFRSLVAAGTNKWNIYCDGFANSYLNGHLGIGNNTQATLNAYRLTIGTTGDTTSAGGILLGGDVQIFREGANRVHIDQRLTLQTQVAVGTYANDIAQFHAVKTADTAGASGYYGFHANMQAAVGATDVEGFVCELLTAFTGSHVGIFTGFHAKFPTVYGIPLSTYIHFKADSVGVGTDIGDAYGFYGSVTALTNANPRWNLYMDGTAPNFLRGGLSLGSTSWINATSAALYINASTVAAGGISFGGGLSNLYRSALNTLKTDGDFIVGGAVTLGPSTGSATFTHLIQNSAGNGQVLSIQNNANTSDCSVLIQGSGGFAGGIYAVFGLSSGNAYISSTNGLVLGPTGNWATCSSAGQWVLGPSTGLTTPHVIQNTAADFALSIKNTSNSTTTCGLRIYGGTGATTTNGIALSLVTHNAAATIFEHYTDGHVVWKDPSTATIIGSIAKAGYWQIGPLSGLDGSHTICNGATTASATLVVQNTNTTSSSDAVPAVYIVKGSSTSNTSQIYMKFAYNGGALVDTIRGVSTGQVQFGSSSDLRMKTDITDYVGNLDRISALRPVIFKWKSGFGKNTEEVCYGFIAQEVEEVIPRAVYTEADEFQTKGLMVGVLIPELVGAIKELKALNDALVERVVALEAK